MQKNELFWAPYVILHSFSDTGQHIGTLRMGEHYLNLLSGCGFANLESLVHENRFESKIALPPENRENVGVPFTGTFHGTIMSQDRIAPGDRIFAGPSGNVPEKHSKPKMDVPKRSQENCLGRTFQRKTVNSQNGTEPEKKHWNNSRGTLRNLGRNFLRTILSLRCIFQTLRWIFSEIPEESSKTMQISAQKHVLENPEF